MAKAEMEQVHRDSPTHQPAVFNLGVVVLRMGDLQESNRWFTEAVRLNPSSDLGRRAQQLLTQHTVPK
jgi:Tfp pilus assembly protein PilF